MAFSIWCKGSYSPAAWIVVLNRMLTILLCSKNEYTKSESNSQLKKCLIGWKYKLCSKNEYTKSESNSQLYTAISIILLYCVQRTNIQNLKAIHNKLIELHNKLFIVFKERIYKIWKQFTTGKRLQRYARKLCSKNEYTKSESNSQLMSLNRLHVLIVFKERIYKIWKQFTTERFFR